MLNRQTLLLEHIHKSFGSQRALDDVSVEFHPGHTHALVGSNGAGKSTLAWLLAGRFADYRGRISIGQHAVQLTSRCKSLEHGIHIVTQEPALAPNLSIGANLFLGANSGVAPLSGVYSGAPILKAARRWLADFGLDLDAAVLVRELPLEQRQSIDLLRAYIRKPAFLVVDEPPLPGRTYSSSTFAQVAEKLRGNGTHLLLITHQISKALSMADTVTIIRDGQVIATRLAKECQQAEVLKLMFPSIISLGGKTEDPIGLTAERGTRSLNILLRSNSYRHSQNIVVRESCVTGLRTTPIVAASKILRSAVGIERSFEVVLKLDDDCLPVSSPYDAVRQGIIYLSADRELEAVFSNLTVRDNLTFHLLGGLSVLGIIRRGRQRAVAERLAMQVDIDRRRLDESMRNLSGGNQQRTLLGRVAGANPTVCLFDEPNRGVDMASLPLVELEIRALAKRGRWVVVASTDEAFLEGVSDRIEQVDFEPMSDRLQ